MLAKHGKGDWSKLNRDEYLAVAADLQKWLDTEYLKRVTPEAARAEQIEVRMHYLFEELRHEALRRNPLKYDDPRRRTLNSESYAAYVPLDKAGLLQFDAPSMPKELQNVKPITRAYYSYFLAALKHDPVFQDLDEPWNRERILSVYTEHVAKGRNAQEEAAHETALRALEVAAGLREEEKVADSSRSVALEPDSSAAGPNDVQAVSATASPAADISRKDAPVARPQGLSTGEWIGLVAFAAVVGALLLRSRTKGPTSG